MEISGLVEQNKITNWKRKYETQNHHSEFENQNAITNYNAQLAEQVIRKDYPTSQSKTNRTLITSNQSQIMKLIRLKEIGTLRL